MLLQQSAHKDIISQVLGSQVAPGYADDVMSYNPLTTSIAPSWVLNWGFRSLLAPALKNPDIKNLVLISRIKDSWDKKHVRSLHVDVLRNII